MPVPTPIVAAIIGALFGALLGSFGTYFIQRRVRYREQRRDRNSIRSALKAELEVLDGIEDFPDQVNSLSMSTMPHLPTQLYDSIGGDIRNLSSGEMMVVIGFYGRLHLVDDILRGDMNNLPEDELQTQFSQLEERRAVAVDVLQTNKEEELTWYQWLTSEFLGL